MGVAQELGGTARTFSRGVGAWCSIEYLFGS